MEAMAVKTDLMADMLVKKVVEPVVAI